MGRRTPCSRASRTARSRVCRSSTSVGESNGFTGGAERRLRSMVLFLGLVSHNESQNAIWSRDWKRSPVAPRGRCRQESIASWRIGASTGRPRVRAARVPRYLQVASALRRRIREGRWAVGERIATIAALQREFRVARVTVRQAIELLAREGLLRARQGKGTFVTREVANDRWLRLATDWESLIAPIRDNVPHLLRTPHLLPPPRTGRRHAGARVRVSALAADARQGAVRARQRARRAIALPQGAEAVRVAPGARGARPDERPHDRARPPDAVGRRGRRRDRAAPAAS